MDIKASEEHASPSFRGEVNCTIQTATACVPWNTSCYNPEDSKKKFYVMYFQKLRKVDAKRMIKI